MKKILFLLSLLIASAVFVPEVDAQVAARRIIFVTSLGATCNLTTGDVAMLTSGTPTGLYYCSAANVWTPVGSTGTGGSLIFGLTTTFDADYTNVTGTAPGIMGVETSSATTFHQFTGEQHGANASAVKLSALKTRGTGTDANTIVASADGILNITGYGADGATFIAAAQIIYEVDGTPGVGDMPGRIAFSTTLDGTATLLERFRINNAGTLHNLGVAPDTDLTGVVLPTELLGATNTLTQYATVAMGANTTAAGFTAFKTRSTASDANTIIVSGDDALSIRAYGADGAAYIPLATITLESGGTPGLNDMPGQIGFWTTADGAATLTERWRITESGLLTPVSNGVSNIGTATLRLNDIFTNEVRNGGTPATPTANAGAYFSTGVAFASLGTPTDGYLIFCTNCDPPPAGAVVACTSAGTQTGAWAGRVNSTWRCW